MKNVSEWAPTGIERYEFFFLRDLANTFKETALNAEHRLKILEAKRNDVPGYRSRATAMESLKSVSHFNLGTALELSFKLMLRTWRHPVPATHKLTELYDALPDEVRTDFDGKFEMPPEGDLARSYANGEHPPVLPRLREVLWAPRDYLVYLDHEIGLSGHRYTWETVAKQEYRSYLTDISWVVGIVDLLPRDSLRGRLGQS